METKINNIVILNSHSLLSTSSSYFLNQFLFIFFHLNNINSLHQSTNIQTSNKRNINQQQQVVSLLVSNSINIYLKLLHKLHSSEINIKGVEKERRKILFFLFIYLKHYTFSRKKKKTVSNARMFYQIRHLPFLF